MTKHSWKSIAAAAVTVAAFAVILNPELRALLLVIEVLGIDVVILLLAAQARTMFPMIGWLIHALTRFVCVTASAASGYALRAFVLLLPVRLFAVSVCPVLLSSAFLMRCDRKVTA